MKILPFVKSTSSAFYLVAALLFIAVILPSVHSQESDTVHRKFIENKLKAEKGDAEAEFNLALNYDLGIGVEKDDSESVKWIRKAAEHNHARAQFALGYRYETGRGVRRDFGEGVWINEDFVEAATWYRKAAAQNNADGQNALGELHEQGRGVTQNSAEAVRWYRKAAAQNHAAAQKNIGLAHHLGRGVPQDMVVAVEWYRKAAEQANAVAQNHLGRAYETGRGVEKDLVEAAKWYRKAAEQGFAQSQSNMGVMYEQGLGVPQDFTEAVRWFRKSAEQGSAQGQWRLGLMYEQGSGVTQDHAEAATWYRKAADQNNMYAQNALGAIIANRKGGGQNKEEAYKWFYMAAAAGHTVAANNLDRMAKELEGLGLYLAKEEAKKYAARVSEIAKSKTALSGAPPDIYPTSAGQVFTDAACPTNGTLNLKAWEVTLKEIDSFNRYAYPSIMAHNLTLVGYFKLENTQSPSQFNLIIRDYVTGLTKDVILDKTQPIPQRIIWSRDDSKIILISAIGLSVVDVASGKVVPVDVNLNWLDSKFSLVFWPQELRLYKFSRTRHGDSYHYFHENSEMLNLETLKLEKLNNSAFVLAELQKQAATRLAPNYYVPAFFKMAAKSNLLIISSLDGAYKQELGIDLHGCWFFRDGYYPQGIQVSKNGQYVQLEQVYTGENGPAAKIYKYVKRENFKGLRYSVKFDLPHVPADGRSTLLARLGNMIGATASICDPNVNPITGKTLGPDLKRRGAWVKLESVKDDLAVVRIFTERDYQFRTNHVCGKFFLGDREEDEALWGTVVGSFEK